MVGSQVKADRIDIHRDAGLAVIIILPVFVALKPLMFMSEGLAVSAFDWELALFCALGSIAVSLLSANWNAVLSIPLLFFAFRLTVSLVLHGGYVYSPNQNDDIWKTVVGVVAFGLVGLTIALVKPYQFTRQLPNPPKRVSRDKGVWLRK
jgi:hypothetical protein